MSDEKKSKFDEFKEGQKDFGHTISSIINSILLTIAYLLGIGLTSVIAKLIGKKFLDLSKENKNTYWEDLNLGREPIEVYYRQF